MARRAHKSTPLAVATESFASRRPLREREVVSISLKTTDGLFFSLYLSRVPCIGEEVFCEGEVYLITRVQHDELDGDCCVLCQVCSFFGRQSKEFDLTVKGLALCVNGVN